MQSIPGNPDTDPFGTLPSGFYSHFTEHSMAMVYVHDMYLPTKGSGGHRKRHFAIGHRRFECPTCALKVQVFWSPPNCGHVRFHRLPTHDVGCARSALVTLEVHVSRDLGPRRWPQTLAPDRPWYVPRAPDHIQWHGAWASEPIVRPW